MTISEDTRAALSSQTASIVDSLSGKDKLALDLAASLDTKDVLLKAAVKTGNEIQEAYDQHMLAAHPVVKPPAVQRRTLHGLGGGNLVRTGIELDRRYYAYSGKTKMINDTTNNEARGTVSWNSMKFPYAWDRMAKGEGDAWFKDIMKGVSEGIKPVIDDPDDVDVVWFSGHHEPEGDQPDERLWRDTQERLSLLVPGGSKGPIKFWLTTTGWNQEYNTAAAAALVDWANLFPKSGDIFGVAYDAPYNTYGKIYKDGVATGEFNNKVTDPFAYVDAVATRAKQFGVEAALGEWGYGDEMFAKDPTWRDKVMDRCINNPIQQVIGEAYFDTRLNSTHTWYLGDGNTPKRVQHMAAMAARKGK